MGPDRGPSGPRPCRRVATTRPYPLPPLSRRRLAGVCPRHGVHSGGGEGLVGSRGRGGHTEKSPALIPSSCLRSRPVSSRATHQVLRRGGCSQRSSTRFGSSAVDDARHDWPRVRGRRAGPQRALTIGCWAEIGTNNLHLKARVRRAANRAVWELLFGTNRAIGSRRQGRVRFAPCHLS